MLSIGSYARHIDKNDGVNAAGQPAVRSRVLPAVFRKPVRGFNRLMAGDALISQRGWLVLALAMGLTASAGVFANSRQGHSVVADLSANMGFTIKSVIVEGIENLSQGEVVSSLELGRSNSLFSFDINKARADLQKLAWVKDVDVAKSYPDRLIVSITERLPYAIWQKENNLTLIERGGKAIEPLKKAFPALPLLVGNGANIHGAEIIYQVANVPVLLNRVKAYARIANRRWDLHLTKGMIVRLPEENPGMALRHLAHLDQAHQLLKRDLEVVDLRLPDRLVVAMGAVASERLAERTGNISKDKSIAKKGTPASLSKKPAMSGQEKKT